MPGRHDMGRSGQGQKAHRPTGASSSQLKRGFRKRDNLVPPKEIDTEFGSMTNFDRMEFNPQTGEYEDQYEHGGFLPRGITADDEE